jgi:hypothetical protein
MAAGQYDGGAIKTQATHQRPIKEVARKRSSCWLWWLLLPWRHGRRRCCCWSWLLRCCPGRRLQKQHVFDQRLSDTVIAVHWQPLATAHLLGFGCPQLLLGLWGCAAGGGGAGVESRCAHGCCRTTTRTGLSARPRWALAALNAAWKSSAIGCA